MNGSVRPRSPQRRTGKVRRATVLLLAMLGSLLRVANSGAAAPEETYFVLMSAGTRGSTYGSPVGARILRTEQVPVVRGAHYFGVINDSWVRSFVVMDLAPDVPPTTVFGSDPNAVYHIAWQGSSGIDARPCRATSLAFPSQIVIGTSLVESAVSWRYDSARSLCGDVFPGLGDESPIRWTLPERTTFKAFVRRHALDGGEYDAKPMSIERNGNPWLSYYWGYKLGLVESESDWDERNRSNMPADWPIFPSPAQDFKLISLPPPWVEGEVTEYVNTADFPRQPDGQYFYAASDTDRAALDGIATWRRTGNSFKQGGYVSVCRFYGGANGGPNTHFYSADATECNWLKGFGFLSYEGQTFRVNKPLPLAANAPAGTQPSCPTGSKPLYRLYNNASAPGKNYVSNHRYVTSRSVVDAAVAIGWLDEGVGMCVPE